MSIKLVVLYPRPIDEHVFERVNYGQPRPVLAVHRAKTWRKSDRK